ncbi:MAG: hypothetical protein PHH54_06375 [Candidatus Nanoarchaeia archaeon]|nr:hypothetical protein [Candidatus Nanoarchaeia archaeon]MDD5741581.1 hypothetical protein [Candidatus Nanoarchaeia archaeon]
MESTIEKTIGEIETSITLDYRKNAWGLERIALDGISNHLPADSKGKQVSVKFKQDGKHLGFKEVDTQKPIEEIIFEDDGSGYDAGLLSVLYTTKYADSLSVGEFGEGLKLIAAASIRSHLDIEYRSRNWTAKPFTKDENIDGNVLKRLCFKIVYNGKSLNGSNTVFSRPTKRFVEEVLHLPDKVLKLNTKYKELYCDKEDSGYRSRIIDLGNHEKEQEDKLTIDDSVDRRTALFVKGVRIEQTNDLFSYDLGIENITPDRIYVHRETFLNQIRYLLETCSNEEVIKKILIEAKENPHSFCNEFNAFDNRNRKSYDPYSHLHDESLSIEEPARKHEEALKHILEIIRKGKKESLWVKCFKELYGENAVIASSYDTNTNKDAEIIGHNPIRLNDNIERYLESLGIVNAGDLDNDKRYEWIKPEDLTPDEIKVLEGVKRLNRLLLDGRKAPEIRVYSRMYLKSGREVKCDDGFYGIDESTKLEYIGLKRSTLKDSKNAEETYGHEAGHYVTKEPDYSRKFTDFFVRKFTDLAREKLDVEEGK